MSMTLTMAMLRHILTFGGGLLIAKGYGDAATVEAVAGALLTIIGGIWSIVEKRSRS
jgi:hypothetical protein